MARKLFFGLGGHFSTAEAERARSDTLFNSIGIGAITTDETGKINRVNKAALDILGYKERELLGKWFPKTIIALDSDGNIVKPLHRSITHAFLSGKPISKKTFYQTKDFRVIPVFATVSPILVNNVPIGAMEIFRDISTEEEVDRMKSEFISVASHQLRTPLTAIKTYAHLLAGEYAGKLNPQQEEFVNTILTSVDRMNMLVTVLLDISKIESGKLHIVAKRANLNNIANDILQELKHQAENKKIKLTLNLPPTPIITVTDPLLTKEIYVNLLSNAIKYTPEGGEVTASLGIKGHNVVFSVTDTGYGIPAAVQERIFTKFYRAHNITDKGTEGTGLGLYLVHSLAENMGGKIWFKSREGEGSTFYFSIPVQEPHDPAIKTPPKGKT